MEGTPAEIGFQHGYLLAPEIEDAHKVIVLGPDPRQPQALFVLPQAAEKVLWPRVEPQYREELKGIAEGLKARGVALDLWDVVAMNASLELSPYYTGWYDKQHQLSFAAPAGARALQRLRRGGQLHARRQGGDRAQQLDRI